MAQCLITGTLVTLTGQPLSNEVVGWRVDSAPNAAPFVDGKAVGREELVATTDAQGQFSVTLTQGLAVIVRIEALSLCKQITIPAQPTATLEELLDASL